MAQYIDKDALVAEIKRRKQVAYGWMETAPNEAIEAEFELCDAILSFIDTLEVKEVDYDKEVTDFLNKFENANIGHRLSLRRCAKHFFELGLKASYNIDLTPNIDTILEEEGIDPYSKEAKLYKEAVNKAFYKYLDNTQKGE